ncbi:MAG: excalibur calcium-binding domain-containing protein [Thermoleophilia bacterium]
MKRRPALWRILAVGAFTALALWVSVAGAARAPDADEQSAFYAAVVAAGGGPTVVLESQRVGTLDPAYAFVIASGTRTDGTLVPATRHLIADAGQGYEVSASSTLPFTCEQLILAGVDVDVINDLGATEGERCQYDDGGVDTPGEPQAETTLSRAFLSPSRNIRCTIRRGPGAARVTCRTLRPGRAALLVNGLRPRAVRPSTGGVRPDARVLPYGRSLTYSRFRCTSRTVGVTCVQRGTRRGFLIAREGVVLLPRPRVVAPPIPTPAPAAPRGPSGPPASSGYNCDDFPLSDGTTAQDYLNLYPSDPSGLDGDNDGEACENS